MVGILLKVISDFVGDRARVAATHVFCQRYIHTYTHTHGGDEKCAAVILTEVARCRMLVVDAAKKGRKRTREREKGRQRGRRQRKGRDGEKRGGDADCDF